MTTEERNHYASYAAPQHHGEKLLEPDLNSVQSWLLNKSVGLKRFGSTAFNGDTDLATLSQSARSSLLQSAKKYTASYRDLPSLSDGTATIVMGGHQPDLFHCGVWFKNFVLSQLGKSHGAIPIHFIVDNDLCRTTGIHVPHLSAGEASKRWVQFDTAAEPMPWENRQLLDNATWHSFPSRIHEVCAKLQRDPLLDQLWQHARQLDFTAPLGHLLSQARHLVERDLGLQTLELPLSQFVSTAEFAQFSWHLLTQMSRFHQDYNAELDAYRQAHHIRNHAQPLPNLAADERWLETPFWCYADDSITRESLWVRHQSGQMLLSDRKGWEFTILDSTSTSSAVEQWMELQSRGRRIRPRALITTMYARMILCDLFVHGIGGGKYDQITDRIVKQFFGMTPPPYVVASATMHLKFDNLAADLNVASASRMQAAQQEFNALSANPELLLQMPIPSLSVGQKAELAAVAEQKQQLLASMPSKGEKWEWHLAMKKVKRELAELALPHLKQLQVELDKLQYIAKQQSILNSREYSFCLFSIDEIHQNLS